MMREPHRNRASVVVAVLLVVCSSVGAADELPRFSVSIPSIEIEARFVWDLLGDIGFYRSNNYQLSLPNTPTVAALIEKAAAVALDEGDWNRLRKDFEGVYDRSHYERAYEITKEALPRADGKIPVLAEYRKKWGFQLPKKYNIRLTLYGPGGSYDPETGTIVLLTSRQATFKTGPNPLETILHEAVHIGIEASIVARYRLTHWTKERIVDQFMASHFIDICPGYRMQPNPETRIDTIFGDPSVWDDLPARIARFLSDRGG